MTGSQIFYINQNKFQIASILLVLVVLFANLLDATIDTSQSQLDSHS
jgi:hypothetical protein